jgi:hypothetical protein
MSTGQEHGRTRGLQPRGLRSTNESQTAAITPNCRRTRSIRPSQLMSSDIDISLGHNLKTYFRRLALALS